MPASQRNTLHRTCRRFRACNPFSVQKLLTGLLTYSVAFSRRGYYVRCISQKYKSNVPIKLYRPAGRMVYKYIKKKRHIYLSLVTKM